MTSSLSLIIPPPPTSPLFPYTTLFRSLRRGRAKRSSRRARSVHERDPVESRRAPREPHPGPRAPRRGCAQLRSRSEEHTSELQSPCNLVCRLLLEKKNKHYLNHLLILS